MINKDNNFRSALSVDSEQKYNLKQDSVCYTNFVICEDDKVPFRMDIF